MRSTAILRSCLALAATALLAGCGAGSDDTGADAEKLSAAFTEATGVKLVARESGEDLVTLRPVESRDYGRFGVFSIYVFSDEKRRESFLKNGLGDSIKEYGDGIVLSSPTSGRDEGVATRLDQAMRAAVQENPALIPARERDCTSVGIDPARGKEGTCRLSDKQLTIVNAATELRTAPLTARLEGATTRAALPRRSRYSDPSRAQGRYVVLRMTVTNAGTSPLSSLRTNLVIGPNTYSESADSYQLEDPTRGAFPLQPGATAQVAKAFDIPADAAARALTEGAIELPAGSDDGGSYLNDREAVGRIRLADAPALRLAGSATSGSSSSSAGTVAAKRAARIRSAEHALREFYSAMRKGNVRYVCRRLTRAVQNTFGGPTACRQGRFIKATAKAKAPRTTAGLRYTTVLTSNQTRAFIVVRGKNGFTDAAKLARQDGLWRVQGTRRLTGGR